MTTQRRASRSCLAVDAGGWPGPRPLAGQTPFSPDSPHPPPHPPPSPARKPPPHLSAPPLTPSPSAWPLCLPPPVPPTPPPLQRYLLRPPSCLQRDTGLFVGLPFPKGCRCFALPPTPTELPPPLCLHPDSGSKGWDFQLGTPGWKSGNRFPPEPPPLLGQVRPLPATPC